MKKENIDFVFDKNPELARIGTKDQYEKYLKTIFPESKVQDIVYRRGMQKIETFNKSKTKEINGNRFYFSPFDTGRYGQYIIQALLNIKNLAVPYDDNFIEDINKKHPEYTKGKSEYFHLPSQIYINADKYGYDGVFAFEGTNDDEYSVYSPDQIHILGSKKDLKGFKEFIKKPKDTLENKIISGLFVLTILTGLAFSTLNLTGNTIGITQSSNRFLGIILFLIGISGFFINRKL